MWRVVDKVHVHGTVLNWRWQLWGCLTWHPKGLERVTLAVVYLLQKWNMFSRPALWSSLNGNSSTWSIWITCPIFSFLWSFGFTQREATKRARFNALEESFSDNLGSQSTFCISVGNRYFKTLNQIYLSLRSIVIHWISSWNHLYKRNAKAIYITLLI